MRREAGRAVMERRGPGRPRKDAKEQAQPAPSRGPLDAYFRDLRRHKLITGQAAVQAVREIRRQEVAFWTHVLSFPAAVGFVRRVATDALADPEKEPLPKRATAEQIRAADVDLDGQRAVLAALRDAAALRGEPGFPVYLRTAETTAWKIGQDRAVFLQANLRLVANVASRFQGRGLDLPDLIQEGSLGLMKALGRYEPERGFLFTTYSMWWIKQAIHRAIQNHKQDVRLPIGLQEQIRDLAKARWDRENKRGGEVSIEEVAEEGGVQVEKAKKLVLANRGEVSVDIPVGEDGDGSLLDFLTAPEHPVSALDAVASEDMRRKMLALINRYLTERQRTVIIRRFGLHGDAPEGLAEIGSVLGVTRERIRQIETKAMAKLRRRTPKEWASL